MRTLAFALIALALAAACAPSTLPGTKIADTPQNRAVLTVFARYQQALEGRDPQTLLALAAPGYYDAGDPGRGIPPVDYAALRGKLQHDFDSVTGLKLEATLKDVEVKGDEAHVDYFQVLRYGVKTSAGEKWKSESDDARMRFKKVGGEWKIASGL